jgi:hypothetical protein
MSTDEIELQETEQCAICLEKSDESPPRCIQCNNCNLCPSCILNLQEYGAAAKCPVCRKESPWCNDLAVVIDKPQRSRFYSSEMLQICLLRFIAGLLCIIISWATGYLWVYSDQEKYATMSDNPFILNMIVYIVMGGILLFMIGFFLSLCIISCLSLGIPSRQN